MVSVTFWAVMKATCKLDARYDSSPCEDVFEMMPMFWVRWIKYPLVPSDDGIIRVKMKPKRLSGVSEEGDGSFSCVCRRLSLSVEFPLSVFHLPFYEFGPSGESLLLCDNGQLHKHVPLLSYFGKISHMSLVWACVSWWLCKLSEQHDTCLLLKSHYS